MYGGEEKIWLNQTYIQYKDLGFGSNSTLEISTSVNTSNFKHFSLPRLNIRIISDADRRSRNCLLNLFDIRDLLTGFNNAVSDLEKAYAPGQEIGITRKYGNKSLQLNFRTATSTQERCIVIDIVHSESDYGRIIMTLEKFRTVASFMKSFYDNIQQFNYELISMGQNSKVIELLEGVERSIKALPSFVANISSEQSNILTQEPAEQLPADDQQLLTDFMDANLDKIEVPELGKVEEPAPIQEIESPFIRDFLKNDLTMFETTITAARAAIPHPMSHIIGEMKSRISMPEGFRFLPKMNENDGKSIRYVSKLMYLAAEQAYNESSRPVPASFPVLKVNFTGEPHSLNVEISYDLFLISAYLKCFRGRVEEKQPDSDENKAIFYAGVRLFTDVLCFTYIDKIDHGVILNCVLSRFKQYKEAGFFKAYEEILNRNHCQEITSSDIQRFVQTICESVVGKPPYIQDLHEGGYKGGQFKLPYLNDLSLEQILNEFVKIEVSMRLGQINVQTDEEAKIAAISRVEKISPEVIEVLKQEKIEDKPESKPRRTHLDKFVTFNKEDLPENIRESFIEYIVNLGDNDYPFENSEFKLDDLDEKFIKALYCWNENRKVSYSEFTHRVSELRQRKEDILVKHQVPETEVKENGDYMKSLDDMDFSNLKM